MVGMAEVANCSYARASAQPSMQQRAPQLRPRGYGKHVSITTLTERHSGLVVELVELDLQRQLEALGCKVTVEEASPQS